MTKKLVIAGILILVLGSGAYVLTQGKSSNTPAPTTVESDKQATTQTKPQTSDSKTPVKEGAYVDYTDTVIAETNGTKVLFFHAPWCPQCRELEDSIKTQGVPEGVTIIKVDYDSNQGLRKKYGVTIQTTLVKVDDNGNQQKKFVAYSDPTIQSVTQGLL